ncbi:MAG: SEC-C metal-binding domain-containing protein, partial [bacterium]
MKKGRNSKCHCGSGKKYKQCHESKDSKNSNQYFLIGGVCFVFIIIFFLSTEKDNNS